MPFTFEKLEIPDVLLVKPRVFDDDRGFFMETYKSTDFSDRGIEGGFLQDNHSKSVSKGTLRGLHYQKNPRAQAKLVRVIKGSVLDVAVDIRKGSVSYGKWVGHILTDKNYQMLYIPEGFAHGFCTLEDNTEVMYKCSDVYSMEEERGIIWNDPEINVKWPVESPFLSEKDKKWPALSSLDNDFTV